MPLPVPDHPLHPMSRILAPLNLTLAPFSAHRSLPADPHSPTSILSHEKSSPSHKKPSTRQAAELLELVTAARDAIRTLRSLGVHSCTIGDLACRLLGASHTPTEIEILVIAERMNEDVVKRRLAFHNPRFYLVSDPSNSSIKTLHYRPTTSPDHPVPIYIQVPPSAALPFITSADIEWHLGFPLAPLSLLLLLKLRLWGVHHFAQFPNERRQQYADHADLQVLLTLASRKGLKPRQERCCFELMSEADGLVKEYVQLYPASRVVWVKLGLLAAPRPIGPPPVASSSASTSTTASESSMSRSSKDQRRPLPPTVQPPPRPATMMETLRSKSPFLRKRSSSKLQQPMSSYMEWE